MRLVLEGLNLFNAEVSDILVQAAADGGTRCSVTRPICTPALPRS